MVNTGTAPTEEARLRALKTELDAKAVPSSLYSLGKARDERTCFLTDSGRWLVFYSERGQMSDLKDFSNFEDARNELLKRLS
jgi:hypothetical protein